MPKTIIFLYNKWFAYISSAGLLSFILIFIFRSYQLSDPEQVRILEYFEFLFLVFLLFVVYKFILPVALKKPPLQYTTAYLYDAIRNRRVNWSNIKAVRIVSFRSGSSGIAIDLIDKDVFLSSLKFSQKILAWTTNLFYGSPIVLPFQYIDGSNADIFQSISSFLNATNCGKE